ncbi:predicted protein [Naegleria gruberi]|uniref:Predicted protein n=1 Tax=Naegleria gruberi TaxID=5762 RepID=D2VSC4_NAEGR|nr:uncharacterized protein NAEGRDRAFT_81055 [Naegleria gruberi]EFC40320.1 predicted protein [Naegleria gruberi]|eukprot:XP_002673064.1 predicted protein [Naegleria gruberi strain NEG-M]
MQSIDAAVSIVLDKTPSSPNLKLKYAQELEIKKKQFEYLQDLSECKKECIHYFIDEYPIPYPDDRNFILEIAKNNPESIGKLPKVYLNNVEFVKFCLDNDCWDSWTSIPEECEEYIELVKKAVFKYANMYGSLSENVKSQIDPKEMIEHWMHLPDRRYFAIEMKSDFNWKEDEEAFDALLYSKNNLEIVGRKPAYYSVLQCAPQFFDDREFVMRIIDHDPSSYLKCSDRLKNDKEIVLKLLSKNGQLIGNIPQCLKDDRDIIKATLSSYSGYFNYLSETFKMDRELVLIALRAPKPFFGAQTVDKSFYNDPEIIDLIIRSGYIEKIDDFSDFTVDQIKDCVDSNTYTPELKNYFRNASFSDCLEVIKHNPSSWTYWDGCQDCPFIDELVLTYIQHLNPDWYCLPYSYQFKSIEQFKNIIRYDVNGEFLLCNAPKDALNDREIAMHYVKCRPKTVFPELSPEMQSDPIIRKEAIKNGLLNASFIPLK